MKKRVFSVLVVFMAAVFFTGAELCPQAYTAADLNASDSEGLAAYRKGDYNGMVDAFTRSVRMCEQLYGTNSAETAFRYNYLGLGYNMIGDYDKAVVYHEKALRIRLQVYGEHSQYTAVSYNNLGQAYKKKGDYARAIGNYEKSVKIFLEFLPEDSPDIAICYDNLGIVYLAIKDYERAVMYHEKAIKIFKEKLGEKSIDTGICYNNLGAVYSASRDFEKAIEYYGRALDIYREVLGEMHPNTAICYDNIGSSYMNMGNYDMAIEYFKNAQKIGAVVFGDRHPDMAISYDNIAGAYQRKGDYRHAVEFYRKAFEVVMNTGANQEKAGIALNLGVTYMDLRMFGEASEAFMSGIDTVEKVRRLNLSGGSDFTARNIQLYYYAVSAYFLGRDVDSMFSVSERMRAMGYIERLSIKGAIEAAGIDPEQGKKLLKLRDDIERLTDIRNKLISIPVSQLEGQQKKERDERFESVSKELAQAEAEFNSLDAEFMKNEKYMMLRDMSAVSVLEAQEFCGSDGAIIEYIVPEKPGSYLRPFAIVITGKGADAVPLDDKFDYPGQIEKYRKAIQGNVGEAVELSAELYRQLVAPVSGYINRPELKRLIVVPDGVLAFLPFDSLKTAEGTFLGERYELTLMPSVTVSVMIKARKYDKRDSFIAFGGGTYSLTGESSTRGRVTFRGVIVDTDDREKLAATSFSSPLEYYRAQQLRWSDLPGTEREVSAINEKIFGKKNTEIYTGEKVSEEHLKSLSKSGKLKKYSSIHLACHGYYDPEYPAYSAVVFSEVSGKLKNSKDDGYMSVEETALLNLQSEIVVLSACETGLGRMVSGDGVIGLTRAFQVAGSNRVLVTLWPVSDEATEQFMVLFYKKVKEGMSYREALVKVKEEFRKSKDYSAPYFWAGFVLYE